MKVCRAVLVAAVLACLGIGGSVALAAGSKPAGGKIQFFVRQVNSTKAKILLTGAIGDYGVTVSTDKNGTVDPNGDFQKVTLTKGGFTVDATAFDKALQKAKPKVDPATCSVVFSGTGPGTVSDGTRLYQGISGKLNISIVFAGIAARKSGKCNFGQNVRLKGNYQSISGTGNVSFG